MSPRQADRYVTTLLEQHPFIQHEFKDHTVLLFDNVVILASSISSRGSHRFPENRSIGWFLEEMWDAVCLFSGPNPLQRQIEVEGTPGGATLVEEDMGGFGNDLLKFRQEVLKIQRVSFCSKKEPVYADITNYVYNTGKKMDPSGSKHEQRRIKREKEIDQRRKNIEEKLRETEMLDQENKELVARMELLEQKCEGLAQI